jgi:DNA-binding response OmpR family regulator
VRVAEDPAKAPELAKQDPPDLVLMDLYMPNIDGLELCRRLKSEPMTKNVKVVLFTGSDEEIDKLSGKEAGAFDYITKPIDARKLVARVQAILDAR